MVAGAFPIAKLSVLLIKQISKPIANACKERAKNSPFFRTYVCMPPAQFYNWCEVKAKMWILNLGKPVNIPVLSQEMAIELGANLLGESVIFIIGAGLLVVEYNRQSKKEAAKETKREEEMKHFTDTITDLYFTVKKQETQLREMERLIHSITGEQTPSKTPATNKPQDTPPSSNSIIRPPQNLSYDMDNTLSTPYPNRGIVLQSLNYIQMDAVSFLFPNCNQKIQNNVIEEKVKNHKCEPAILSTALHNIENNFRSLF